MASKQSLSEKYQHKNEKEHILDNPDTYIGSVENVDEDVYILKNNKIISKQISYNPGLFKLFDEGIVNCRDHFIRMMNMDDSEKVTQINISIENGKFTLYNNGNGIDVEKHPEHDIWIQN